MHIPDTLYHRTTKLAYDSIRENGLLGPHNGHWAIYLSERPETWAGLHDGDNILFSVVQQVRLHHAGAVLYLH